MYLHPRDDALAERIAAVTHRWGGDFAVVPVDDWKSLLRTFPGTVVHLTMYGLPLEKNLPRLARLRRILLVVGGAKVPPELYRRAKYATSPWDISRTAKWPRWQSRSSASSGFPSPPGPARRLSGSSRPPGESAS